MQITNVWVNGCFDVLHIGHIKLLEFAKSIGTTLTVGIDTDERVKQAKGPSRPFNKQEDRVYFLQSLSSVDNVVTYSTNEELIQHLLNNDIDIMVVGSDWKGKKVIGKKIVKKIVFFDRIGEYSTTRILNNEIRI